MTTTAGSLRRATPVLRADDVEISERWYAQLGFEVEFKHQFEPTLPRFDSIRNGEVRIYLSEHLGDAVPDGLVYIHVDDVDAVAGVLGAEAEDMPYGMREIRVTDPAGNRVRIGTVL